MIKDNEQDSKFLPTYKWNFCHSVPLCNILSMSVYAPLWIMTRKKEKIVSKNKRKFQFKIGCIFFWNLKKQGIQRES